jgi:hypothetical protein
MPALAEIPPTRVSIGQWMTPHSALHWTIPHVTSWMQSSVPPELPGLVYAKLGDAAWQRFHDFSRWPDGWTGPNSHAIAWGTYHNFAKFLEAARFFTGRPPPSLFVTDAGELELTWEARDGSAINVTLTPNGATYLIESRGEEAEVKPEELPQLAERCYQAAA